jgi:hypothetical protein
VSYYNVFPLKFKERREKFLLGKGAQDTLIGDGKGGMGLYRPGQEVRASQKVDSRELRGELELMGVLGDVRSGI